MAKARKGTKTPNTWGGLLKRGQKLRKGGIKPTAKASKQDPLNHNPTQMDANGELVQSTGPNILGGVKKRQSATDKAGYLGKDK